MNIQYLERPGKPRLAYVYTQEIHKQLPPVVFLGGYRSDMSGTKATYLEQQCKEREQSFLRFDYSGHGQSEGKFSDGTIGAWKQDALDVINHVIKEPAILVGSSMGGWMALLAAIARPDMVKGLIGIAAAPDFTEEIYDHLTAAQKTELEKIGRVSVPNDYSDEPYHFTKAFYEEAKNHMVLGQPRAFNFPVRLIQGKQDKDVPWRTVLKIQKNFMAKSFEILFIEDGDHRLSRPEDLEKIDAAVCGISSSK